MGKARQETHKMHPVKLSCGFVRNCLGDVKGVQNVIALWQEIILQHVVERAHSIYKAVSLTFRAQEKSVGNKIKLVRLVSQVLVLTVPGIKNFLVCMCSQVQQFERREGHRLGVGK